MLLNRTCVLSHASGTLCMVQLFEVQGDIWWAIKIVTDIEEEGNWILAETQYVREEQSVFIEDLEM